MKENNLYKLILYVALISSATLLLITGHEIGAIFMCLAILAVK